MRSFKRILALAMIAVLSLPASIQAGPIGRAIFGPRAAFKQKTVVRGTPTCSAPAAMGCSATVATPQPPAKVLPVLQAPAKVIPAPQVPGSFPAPQPPQVYNNSEAAAFLAAVNVWRGQNGRRPLIWDNNLASFATRNIGHSFIPAGCSQCWSGARGLMPSLSMWKTSGPHAAILLTGTMIGASSGPNGATANIR